MIETSMTQTKELTAKPHQPSRRRCPVCGDSIVVTVKAGQVMLDYHHDRRAGYVKWCSGSDMNLSEAA